MAKNCPVAQQPGTQTVESTQMVPKLAVSSAEEQPPNHLATAARPSPTRSGMRSMLVAMAAAAGIVNRTGRDDDSAFADALGSSSPTIQAVARAVRDLVFDVLPDAVEVVWPKQGSVGWGVGPKKFTEQFAYILPYSSHVTLGFYRGGELPDPARLLPTKGGTQVSGTLSMRSLKLTSAEDVGRADLRALVAAAVEERRGGAATG